MMRFVIVLLSAVVVCSTSAAKSPSVPVVDVDGDAVQQGLQYRLVPADGSRGGMGLMKRNTHCPVHVVEDLSAFASAGGLPVNFTSVESNDTTIYTSTDVNIGFSVAKVCGKSPLWRLAGFDRSTGKWYVTTGGATGVPTVSNRFKVERSGKGYKFVFCPHVCRHCKVVCGDVGAIGGHGQRKFLGVSSSPAEFVFKKASA